MGLKIVTVLALPIAVIVLLRAAPALDARWEDQPAHFWIVLVGRRGQRRAGGGGERGRAPAQGRAAAADRARVPGQRRVPRAARAGHAGRAAGEGQRRVRAGDAGRARGRRAARGGVRDRVPAAAPRWRSSATPARSSAPCSALLALWAVLSLAELPPLRATVAPEDAEAALGVVRADRRRGLRVRAPCSTSGSRRGAAPSSPSRSRSPSRCWPSRSSIVLASLTTSWQLSWWEWHLLMAISFFTIAAAAQREWFEERFSALYLDETLAGRREVTVLFADLSRLHAVQREPTGPRPSTTCSSPTSASSRR